MISPFIGSTKKIKKKKKDEETTCGTSAVFYLSVPSGPQPEPIPDPIPDDD